MFKKIILPAISILILFINFIGCKSSSVSESVKPINQEETKSKPNSTKPIPPDETIKQVMMRIGQNYLALNLTISEHGIFSGVSERATAINEDTKKAIYIIKYEQKNDPELINMLDEMGVVALLIKGCADRNDIFAAKDYVRKWKKFSDMFN